MASVENIQTLKDMGFDAANAEKALSLSGGNLEQAMDWLLAHGGESGGTASVTTEAEQMETTQAGDTETGSDENTKPDVNNEEPSAKDKDGDRIENAIQDTAVQEAAKSIKCDECGKLFKSPEEVEFHAVKSGHAAFSESTEEKRPLTEEERKEKLRELEDKMKQRRKEKEREEAKESREREKKRIQMSKEIADSKRKFQEEEMKRIAEERRREKIEEKMARQKIKEQIERDKEARKEKFANKSNPTTTTAAPITPTPLLTQAPIVKKDYDTTRLQIRLPSGAPLIQEFKSKEPLSAVRLWIEMNRSDNSRLDFSMATTFPRKVFGDDDMEKPLNVLGLVPSAVLMVTNK